MSDLLREMIRIPLLASRPPAASLVACVSLLLTVTLFACRYDTASRVETAADSAENAISFELAGTGEAALVVPVYLNGQGPHQFVLDTGATLTCVNAGLADSLALPERAGQIGTGFSLQESGRVRLVQIDSLRVGAAKAFDLSACSLDLSQLEQAGLSVDGLLGLNFLKSFRVVLDFGSRTLHFQAL